MIRTTKLDPTDSIGARIAVHDSETGTRRTVAYDYGATNPHVAAITEVLGLVRVEHLRDGGRVQLWDRA